MNKNPNLTVLFTVLVNIILIFSIVRNPVVAQDETNITRLQDVILDIYPEYDDPRLLVMIEGQVLATAVFPVEVQFLVPTSAYMYSAGSIDATGNYSGGTHDRTASGITGWDKIIYKVTTDTFRLEYYDPIIIGKTDKTIEYEFCTLYDITNLQVYIQEPLKSKNFVVSPEGQLIQGQDKFNFHLYSYSTFSKDASLKYSINYSKSDSRTSVVIANAFPIIPLIAGIIGSIVILIVIIFVVRLNQKKPKFINTADVKRKSKEVSVQTVRNTKNKTTQKSLNHCHQCGEVLGENTHFCPYCGAEQ
jgi:hypothetical protein